MQELPSSKQLKETVKFRRTDRTCDINNEAQYTWYTYKKEFINYLRIIPPKDLSICIRILASYQAYCLFEAITLSYTT